MPTSANPRTWENAKAHGSASEMSILCVVSKSEWKENSAHIFTAAPHYEKPKRRNGKTKRHQIKVQNKKFSISHQFVKLQNDKELFDSFLPYVLVYTIQKMQRDEKRQAQELDIQNFGQNNVCWVAKCGGEFKSRSIGQKTPTRLLDFKMHVVVEKLCKWSLFIRKWWGERGRK